VTCPTLGEPGESDAKNEILDNGALMEELERAGCTFPPEVDGFKSLLPVRSSFRENEKGKVDLSLKLSTKMLCATWADGKPVILKLTDQHEVEVLRCLHGSQYTKKTRIIPLVDVVDGRLIVLPELSPLSQFFSFDASTSDDAVGVLAVQFMEGVAYLQHSSVAHLDLKPGNIVVHRNRKSKELDLYIIDFDIAVFADVEPTISRSDGTPGWCAPEVSMGKSYNPLLADRWSCGRVLALFTERMKQSPLRETMHVWSQLLMNPDPSLRPSISDLRDLCPCPQVMKPNSSIRLIPGGAPRPGRGKPKSRSVKGLNAKEPRAQRLRNLPGHRRQMGNLN